MLACGLCETCRAEGPQPGRLVHDGAGCCARCGHFACPVAGRPDAAKPDSVPPLAVERLVVATVAGRPGEGGGLERFGGFVPLVATVSFGPGGV